MLNWKLLKKRMDGRSVKMKGEMKEEVRKMESSVKQVSRGVHEMMTKWILWKVSISYTQLERELDNLALIELREFCLRFRVMTEDSSKDIREKNIKCIGGGGVDIRIQKKKLKKNIE